MKVSRQARPVRHIYLQGPQTYTSHHCQVTALRIVESRISGGRRGLRKVSYTLAVGALITVLDTVSVMLVATIIPFRKVVSIVDASL